MVFRAPRGTRDILPGEGNRWYQLESTFRSYCALYGFAEIRTPIFEQTELFSRSVGEQSDIVSKEMYTFTDRSGRSLTLRPECTPAVVRAYLEHNLKDQPQPLKLFYSGPMFRYDRPQAGRYRQFHQMGLELFGAGHPSADVEIIALSNSFLSSLQIDDVTLELNSIGCPDCRPAYREKLIAYLQRLEESLCGDCVRRFKINPLRALDCKQEACRELVRQAPVIADHLCGGCVEHFELLRSMLDRLGISYRLNPLLVRGLDYYTRTVFEFIGGDSGSLGGGGRYDNLVELCGGPPTPAVGVAFGVERLLLSAAPAALQPETASPVYIALAGTGMEMEALELAAQLRNDGIPAESELAARTLKSQLKYAARKEFKNVVIIGEREMEQGLFTLRNMSAGTQEQLPLDRLRQRLAGSADQSPVSAGQDAAKGSLWAGSAGDEKTGCGELSRKDKGRTVLLKGWVQRRRDHGGLVFIDLRDRTGLVQLVFDSRAGGDLFEQAEKLRGEFVIAVRGEVIERTQENINPALDSGEIEVKATSLDILNSSLTPPFYMEDGVNVDENLRLRYRYLDLRRPEMYRRLALRHRCVKLIRDYLDANGFLEIETPFLTRSTPEGARDYLVPSRTHQGSLYALPQSPQLFKQLLMVGGVERYFQIARCFRDEDLRADRQPEFTQIDIEASFLERERLFALIEEIMSLLWSDILGTAPEKPFSRMPYLEAMERFGSDKPDTRFGMELVDSSDLALACEFKVFRAALEAGGVVKGLRVPGGGTASRKEIDDLAALAVKHGARGLAWMIREESGWRSPVAKFFDDSILEKMGQRFQAAPGDLLLFAADSREKACAVLGALRLRLAPEGLPETPHFLWVVDFPLVEYNPEEKRYDSLHHPFTAPMDEDLPLLDSDPLAVRSQAYDLVLNGVELGSGSSRVHRRELQAKILTLLGYSPEEAADRFGFLLEALEYGAPPHGGIALGLDRIIALLNGDDSIRQVIPFPKTASANCLMTGAPSPVDPGLLDELGIRLKAGRPADSESEL